MKPIIVFVLLISSAITPAAFGKSTISYFNGPSFGVAGTTQLDINADGIPDFTFSSGWMICTVSLSSCHLPYFVAGGTNELLGSDLAAILPHGERIGDNGSDWSSGTTLTVYHTGLDFSLLTAKPYWLGGLEYSGLGYLGVRFHAADGLHYGWIRVRLPAVYPNQILSESSPVVMEWAYETRPGVPIQAGDTGEERTEFEVKFLYGNAIVQAEYRSSGRLFIGKDSISYEIHLAGGGMPTSLTLETSQPNRTPLADVDLPYIPMTYPSATLPDFTILFGEISIPHGQAIQASRGRYYLKYDETVIAEIVPVIP